MSQTITIQYLGETVVADLSTANSRAFAFEECVRKKMRTDNISRNQAWVEAFGSPELATLTEAIRMQGRNN